MNFKIEAFGCQQSTDNRLSPRRLSMSKAIPQRFSASLREDFFSQQDYKTTSFS